MHPRTTACRWHDAIHRDRSRRSNPTSASWPDCTSPATRSSATFSTVSIRWPVCSRFEFNKIHTQGQGLVGFDELTSVNAIANADAALDEAGLAFTPVSGHSSCWSTTRTRRITETHDIFIQLDGLDDDTTLNDLVGDSTRSTAFRPSSTPAASWKSLPIRTTPSLRSTATPAACWRRWGSIHSSPVRRPATSRVNGELRGLGNEAKFAASGGGLGREADSGNALATVEVPRQPLDSAGGLTVPDVYDRLVNSISQGATVAGSIAEGFRVSRTRSTARCRPWRASTSTKKRST